MFLSRPRFISLFALCFMITAYIMPGFVHAGEKEDDEEIDGEELPAGEMPDQPVVTAGGLYSTATYPTSEIDRPLTMFAIRTQDEIMVAGQLESGKNQALVFSKPSFARNGVKAPFHKEGMAGMFMEYGLNDKLVALSLDNILRLGTITPVKNPGPTGEAPVLFDFLETNKVPITGYEQLLEGAGDDLYVRSILNIYVCRDRKNWTIDTAGLGKAYVNSMALDSGQSVWVASSKGLFRQAPKGDKWEKVTSFPDLYSLKLFIDRKNRFFVSTGGGVFASTDGGKTFHPDTAGIGMSSVTNFGDDAYGNIFALMSPNQVYISKSGTEAWKLVAGTGLEILADVSDGQNSLLSIFGDSLLVLCTVVGPYTSADQGKTWIEATGKFRDPSLQKIFLSKDGSLYASHARGIFRRKAGEAAWTKVFPDSGYLPYRPFFEDSAGAQYTVGKKVPGNSFQVPMMRASATDPWVADSAGISTVTANNTLVGRDGFYFVDGSGGQHIGDIWNGSIAKIWSKSHGKDWGWDTAGLGANTTPSAQPTAWGNDNAGYVYLAVAAKVGIIVRRPIGGGTWSQDSTGLGGANVYAFAAGKDGKLWAGGIGGLWYRDGGKWNKSGMPTGSTSTTASFALTVDEDGTVIVGFSDFQFTTNKSQGVYATKDGGKTWTLLGMRHVTPRSLYPVGKGKIYATSYGLGVYGLDKAKPLGIKGPVARAIPLSNSFRIRSNPFFSHKVLGLSLSATQAIKVEIIDLQGKRVGDLVSRVFPAGASSFAFDAGFLEEGVYFLRIESAQVDRAFVKFIR